MSLLMYQDMHIATKFVEIIGTVKDDNTVKALTSIPLGESLGELSDGTI